MQGKIVGTKDQFFHLKCCSCQDRPLLGDLPAN